MWGSVLGFTLLAALLTVTPGIDTALVIRATLAGGRGVGLRTAGGVCSGVVTWGLLSAVGVSAVLTASRVAYDVLRIAGAAYLVWLGASSLWRTRKPSPGDRDVSRGEQRVEEPRTGGARRGGVAFRQGMLTNLLNPKVGVFYITLLPQFIPAGAPVLPLSLLMAGIHATEGILWLALVVLIVHRLGLTMRRPGVRRTLERITGVVLIGFGARVALERV